MSGKPIDTLARDQRLQDVVLAYLKAVDAGQAPDQQELLARHPDLAADLRAFFSGQYKIRAGMAPLRGAMEPVSPPPFSKHVFGDYELQQEIAHGGMGIVYKARQISLKRIVALKMIRAGQLASPEEVRRFRTEAENAATLDHPNIVPIYEVGECDGQHYFTMKRIQGGSLAQHLRLFAHSQRASARLVAKVARAVHHGHQRGILHRDLKPANILLDRRGQPHVTDFGLAKRVEGGTVMTQTGVIVGTPSYMAPEQAAGKKQLTTAVDVYGLGTILYELLTGRPPFHAQSVLETVRQVLEKEPPRPRSWNPRLDQDLETICLKCLEKDPAKRYGSAEALAEDLGHWLAGEAIEGRRTGIAERAIKWTRRNRLVATLLGLSTLALLGMVGLLGVLWVNAERRAATVRELRIAQDLLSQRQDQLKDLENRIEQKQGEVQQFDRTAKEAQTASRRALYIRDMQLAQTALENEQVNRTLLLLQSHLPKSDQQDVRGFEWHYLWRQCHRERFVLNGHQDMVTFTQFTADGKTLFTLDNGGHLRLWDSWKGEEVTSPGSLGESMPAIAISPDGKTIARGCEDGSIRLLDWPTGQEKSLLQAHPKTIKALAFSPDGKVLASAGDDRAGKLWDSASWKEHASLHGHPITKFQCFSPDGNMLVTWNDGPTMQLWNLAKGQPRNLNGHAGSWITGAAFSPDGRSLATAEAHPWRPHDLGWIRFWDPITGMEQGHIDVPGSGAFSVLYSPDGKTLAAGHSSLGIVKLWDMPSRELRNAFYGDFRRVYALAFSPDGQLLASGNYDKTARIWQVTSPPNPKTFQGYTGGVNVLAITSDGKNLAACDDGGIRVMDLSTGQVIRALQHNGRTTVAFAPDGKTAVSGSVDGTGKLWDVSSGTELRTLGDRSEAIHSAAFAPEGRIVVLRRVNGTVEFLDPETGQEKLPRLECHPPRGKVPLPGVFLAFSPGGKMLAMCESETKVKLWDLATRKERTLDTSSYSSCPVFSGDGTMLACANWDGTINLWNVASGKELVVFQGHTGHVSAVAFSPDSKTLASCSADATVKLWDLVMMQERFTLKGHATGINSLAFSPDGKTLASGGVNGIVKVWHTRPGD